MTSHMATRDEEPKTVNHDRKKQSTNVWNPISQDRERTEESTTPGEFNRSIKANMTKKPKEDISKLLSTQGCSNIHSKSVNKNKTNQKTIKEKNMSL